MILAVIGGEVYLFVKPRKNNLDNIKVGDTASKQDNLKYIVDVTTSYLKNGLNYKVEKNGTRYYVLIAGLKDKSLENKINTEIKKKVDENSNYFFELFGLKLYFDDILLICLIFFLYQEGVKDDELFISLILLLLS